MSTTPEQQKKGRFSNLFKRKAVKTTESITPPPDPNERSYSSANQNFDSAYASSEPPSLEQPSLRSEPNIVPVDNRGQIENVSSDRNLELNRSTGDVMDRDTGEVVSTVTTTTTTKTTVTTKKGKDGNIVVDVSTNPAGETTSPNGVNNLSSNPVRNSVSDVGNNRASNPVSSTNNVADTSAIVEAPGDAEVSHIAQYDSNGLPANGGHMSQPVIPPRSPHRRSRDMTEAINHASMPGNTSDYNFSHPSRANVRQSGEFGSQVSGPSQGSTPSQKSTFSSLRALAKQQTSPDTYQNLKAAAKGLHGVGETLRGALNNELDTRIPPSDPQARQALQLKNQSVIERGRQEMSRVPGQGDGYTMPDKPEENFVSPIAQSQPQDWPSRSPSRSSGGRRASRKLIKRKSR